MHYTWDIYLATTRLQPFKDRRQVTRVIISSLCFLWQHLIPGWSVSQGHEEYEPLILSYPNDLAVGLDPITIVSDSTYIYKALREFDKSVNLRVEQI